ncbi:hypothetical protein SLS62_009974 [Diatrype stigma]|uniref:Uncharacterized protein n=1 Tax=Diatrype stigma TaxID=117547 RepID=A0AAN9UJ40_9PEZI
MTHALPTPFTDLSDWEPDDFYSILSAASPSFTRATTPAQASAPTHAPDKGKRVSFSVPKDQPTSTVPTSALVPALAAHSYASAAVAPAGQSKEWTFAKSKAKAKGRARINPAPDKERPDDRLFVRINSDHDWHSFRPQDVRASLVDLLKLDLKEITDTQKVKTGWAIRPRNNAARQHILEAVATYEDLKLEEAQ